MVDEEFQFHDGEIRINFDNVLEVRMHYWNENESFLFMTVIKSMKTLSIRLNVSIVFKK